MRGGRTDLRVGPFTLSIEDPMSALRVTIDPNATGISADLTFRARSSAHEKPLDQMRLRVRTVMQTTRYTQFGMWEGRIATKDGTTEVHPGQVYGTRDRSWGWRWTAEPEQGVSRQVTEQVL